MSRRGKRADKMSLVVQEGRGDAWAPASEYDLRQGVNRALADVINLEHRLEVLRARPDARSLGQRDNILGLEDELAGANLQLLEAKFAARVDLVAYHLPRRTVRYEGESEKDLRTATAPAVTVVRTGQMEILYRGADGLLRVRVQDRYQLLVDGAPRKGIEHTRRNVMRQAHMTVAYGVGVGVPEHVRVFLWPLDFTHRQKTRIRLSRERHSRSAPPLG